jgi:ferredoxin
MRLPEARKVLERLASRAILVDIDQGGETQYVLPPPMAGFFEFSLMRVRRDIDQKALSELFYEYLNMDICLGCGLCVRACTEESLALKPLPQRVITPLNATHRAVVMAIERGGLQHLIFDNQVLLSHRALAAVLGVILKLPSIKQALAHRQVKSRYLESLIKLVP